MPRRTAAGFCAVLALSLLPFAAGAQRPTYQPSAEDRALLRTLRPGHPRLIALEPDIERVRGMVRTDTLARTWYERLKANADRILREPPVEHKLIGPRLLDKSRRAMDRIYTLGLLYRMDGDRRYAERARQELLAVCAFADWNPSHFLDTAEMSHAVGIGYDWLYGFLSAEDRAVIRRALVELGMKPGMAVYRSGGWWSKVTHNWNQVCNGGLTVGALAIADEEPDVAAYVVGHAVRSVPLAMASYAPDGGWAEGPGYWNYATRYNTFMLAGMETALGTDFGLSKAPGFSDAGTFRVYFNGPTDRTFNYADAGEREGSADCLFWLDRRFGKPLYAWAERHMPGGPTALDLLWFDPAGKGPKADRLPTSALYRGIDVALMRTAWEDPKALFVGFKGGDNQANHRHLDLGTFVMDADGQRWALDLGGDDYNMPGYFGRVPRYYRQRTIGHNTLVVDGADQNLKAKAKIVSFSARRPFAVADLTQAYAGQCKSVRRGVTIVGKRALLVQDELEADQPVEVVWQMHTAAKVEPSGATAILTQAGVQLNARILEPEGAVFETASATPPPPENQNKGVTKLVVRLPGKVTSTRIAVLLTPVHSGAAPPRVNLAPLFNWR